VSRDAPARHLRACRVITLWSISVTRLRLGRSSSPPSCQARARRFLTCPTRRTPGSALSEPQTSATAPVIPATLQCRVRLWISRTTRQPRIRREGALRGVRSCRPFESELRCRASRCYSRRATASEITSKAGEEADGSASWRIGAPALVLARQSVGILERREVVLAPVLGHRSAGDDGAEAVEIEVPAGPDVGRVVRLREPLYER
jgi:hypothetical protein